MNLITTVRKAVHPAATLKADSVHVALVSEAAEAEVSVAEAAEAEVSVAEAAEAEVSVAEAAEAADADLAVEAASAALDVSMMVHVKCTRQFALNARKNVKFRSSQLKADRSIAVTVSLTSETSNKEAISYFS